MVPIGSMGPLYLPIHLGDFYGECRCISKYIYIYEIIIYHTWILWGWKTIIAFPCCVNRPIFKGDFREKSPGGTRQRLSAEFFLGFHAQHWQKHLQVHNWQFHLREGFICGGGGFKPDSCRGSDDDIPYFAQ